MRVATYTQRTAATQAHPIAVLLFIATIFQGTSITLVLLQHFAPALQAVVTLLWFVSYLIALAGLMFSHGINWIFWIFRYRFLLVILIFGTVASVAWSIDSGVSMQRTVHLLGSCLLAIYFGFMLPLGTLLTILSVSLAVALFASIGVVFAIPELGIESYEGSRVWKGVTTSKNTLGFWAAIGVLLYISQMARIQPFIYKLLYLFLALVSLITLYFSHSATSLLALVVGGSLSLYFFLSIRFQLGFFRMALMAVFFVVVIGLTLANIDTAELLGRSGDLTGRGEVWAQTWKLILDKPLTGYGYGSIWNPNDATIWIQQSLTDFSWVVYHAHNGFLQIASEIGLPLSSIAMLMVVQQLIEIFYCQYQRQQTGVLFVLGFVVAYLVSNYSEARFLVNRELYWILFLTLPISMLRQVNIVLSETNSPADKNYGQTPSSGFHQSAEHTVQPRHASTATTAAAINTNNEHGEPLALSKDDTHAFDLRDHDNTDDNGQAPEEQHESPPSNPSSRDELDYDVFDSPDFLADIDDKFDKDLGIDISPEKSQANKPTPSNQIPEDKKRR